MTSFFLSVLTALLCNTTFILITQHLHCHLRLHTMGMCTTCDNEISNQLCEWTRYASYKWKDCIANHFNRIRFNLWYLEQCKFRCSRSYDTQTLVHHVWTITIDAWILCMTFVVKILKNERKIKSKLTGSVEQSVWHILIVITNDRLRWLSLKFASYLI